MSDIRILKVKMKDGRVQITYDKIQDKGTNKYTLDSFEKPTPEFTNALKELHKHVQEICEFEFSFELLDAINVTGVSFSYSKDDDIGAVITAQRALKNSKSPLNLNTPHKMAEAISDQDDSYCLTPACCDDLHRLIEEARKFIAGERSQLELSFEREDAA